MKLKTPFRLKSPDSTASERHTKCRHRPADGPRAAAMLTAALVALAALGCCCLTCLAASQYNEARGEHAHRWPSGAPISGADDGDQSAPAKGQLGIGK